MKRDKRSSRDGFTLVEILVVVAIIGILAGVVIAKTMGHAENARRQATLIQATNIKSAIMQFEMQVGRLPKDLDELVFEGDEKWPGPFLDSETVPKDGWEQDYRMERRGKRLRVVSPGPDGTFGTDDDLWK